MINIYIYNDININHPAIGVPRSRNPPVKPPVSPMDSQKNPLSVPTGSARSLRLRKGVATWMTTTMVRNKQISMV